MFNKIIVPLDGSEFSEEALPYAVRLANTLGAKLLLVNVNELPPLVKDTPVREMRVVSQGESYLEDIADIIIDQNLGLHIEPNKVQTIAVYGDPNQEIAKTAQLEGACLVVMTTHGRGGVSRLILGSVATAVVKRASVPVILIKPIPTSHPKLWEEVMGNTARTFAGENNHILLPLDGSVESEAAIKPAIEMARKLQANIYLLEMVAPFVSFGYGNISMSYGYTSLNVGEELEKMRHTAADYLDRIQGQIQKEKIECSKLVLIGNPAEGITEYARDINATLLVMATHAPGRLGEVLLGSVTNEVLRQTHLPVLIVKATAQVKESANHLKEVIV